MSTPTVPGIDRNALAYAVHNAFTSTHLSADCHDAADAALAYIAAHHECACDREHDDADEWVEVDEKTWDSLPDGALLRHEWVQGAAAKGRHFIHRDDLPDDPVDERVKVMARALAEHVGSGDPDDAEMWLDDAEDVLAALLDEHGWTVTRKGER